MDAGFHSFKGAFVLDGKVHTITLPAIVGLGETDLGLLQPGLTRQKKQLPFVVRVDDQPFLVGPFVNLFTRPVERLDFDRLSQNSGTAGIDLHHPGTDRSARSTSPGYPNRRKPDRDQPDHRLASPGAARAGGQNGRAIS